ncbi:Cysteine-rich secretory protein family protein [Filimonas lacunae]|uniref:Cysteine-rich secretory protein family protein n=1 Tax=Filimonas lacunae TaxID=477680 RepID=A0A173MDU5_9BACT|nr:CAP domain-containing protein [Filimonas lacunae]BAV05700.1 transporter [Filimonas lacunae]SIT28857.1 Cysteine-rich secretory protein family protein [Filimonas lacunae]
MKKYLGFMQLLVLALVITTSAACQQKKITTTSSVANYNRDGVSLDGMTSDILVLVNKHRKSIGKPALQMLDAASTQAAIHSRNMAQKKVAFSHDGFETRFKNIKNQVPGNFSGAAENVAYGEMTADEVVDGWLHSPGHKKNIEGDYNLTGIGVSKAKDGTVFYTQIFLRK